MDRSTLQWITRAGAPSDYQRCPRCGEIIRQDSFYFTRNGCLLINWHPVGYCYLGVPIRDILTILFAQHQEQLIGSSWRMETDDQEEEGADRQPGAAAQQPDAAARPMESSKPKW